MLVQNHGARSVLLALQRDIALAELRGQSSEVDYWRLVRACVVKSVDPSHWPCRLEIPVHASSAEGLRLNWIFSHIADPSIRSAILDFAERLLRNEPIE